MKKVSLFLTLCILAGWIVIEIPSAVGVTHSYTCVGSSADEGAIQSLWSTATSGDTIQLSGTCGTLTSWIDIGTSTADVKAITIQGPATVIIDTVPVAFRLWGNNTDLVRLTNITIQQVNAVQQAATQGVIEFWGDGKVRADHITFQNIRRYIVNFRGHGLLDSSVDYGRAANGDNRIYVRNGEGTGGFPSAARSLDLGNTNPDGDGGYVENTVFWGCVPNATETACDTSALYPREAITDGEFGGRITMRFNTFHNLGTLVLHGTEGGLNRGPVKVELYANKHYLYTSSSENAIHLRAGNGIIWGNEYINVAGGGFGFNGTYTYYRRNQGAAYTTVPSSGFWYKFGGRGYNGGTPFDYEDTSFTPISGEHNGTNGSSVLQDTTKTWTDDQFRPTKVSPGVGYSYGVCNNQVGSTWYGLCAAIYGSTATGASPSAAVFTYEDHSGGSTCLPPGVGSDSQPCWATGDDYQIRRYFAGLDQTGWAPQTGTTIEMIVSNSVAVLETTGLSGWPNLVWTPFYGFLNVICSTAPGCGDVKPLLQDLSDNDPDGEAVVVTNIIPELHYFNQAEPDNDASCTATSGAHTCGVRVDTFANRNATCTVGVAFWAIDRPVTSWNDESNSNYTGKGELYKCTAANTWTLYYTPLPYPHPLRAEASDPPELNLGGMTPDFGTQGTTVEGIVITGVGLTGAEFSVSGTGVTPSCVIDSDTQATCDFEITGGATVGERNVTATVDENTSNALVFTVIASSGPTLTSISPTSGERGATITMTITGTDLGSAGSCAGTGGGVASGGGDADTDVVLTSLVSWATVSSCTVVNSTTITFVFTIPRSTSETALSSSRNVQVQTASGISNKDFFLVLPESSDVPYGAGRTRRN